MLKERQMKMRTSLAAVVALCAALVNEAAPRKEVEAQVRELEVLKTYLAEARDSLQREIADRWRLKQRAVEQRVVDKEELGRLRQTQERLFSELARIKEECFARERTLEDERKAVAEEKDQWGFVISSLDEVLRKEADRIPEGMPLFVEKRRANLEEVRRRFTATRSPVSTLGDFVDYRVAILENGRRLSVDKQVVMPDEGEPVEMVLARFGYVFAYGLSGDGTVYLVNQSGQLGADRYKIEKVEATELSEFIQTAVPQWQEDRRIHGKAMLDVLQNVHSGLLVSGRKVKAASRIVSFFKKGGPVMVPLSLLALWGLVLVFIKLIQFSRKHKSNRNLYDQVAGMLSQKKNEEALDFATRHKGVVAKVVTTCLRHSRWTRSSAEKAVRELLIEEMPQLQKYLTTLAVIAGAAPLLGLLGTVTGMINLFTVITSYGTSDPKILAGGISEALITTQTGLSIAIPTLLLHNYLNNRLTHIQTEMEKHAIRILNRLWPEAG